ncbi:unnamed protein product [Polarella glacialis]|uniref:Peptidase A1 domain-containing protein n=1 Tax=Polarella glacialis TaxID=89957 RepID=A0A813J8L9_POLGL|nr:unnamed protein product [Polarella glacialis]
MAVREISRAHGVERSSARFFPPFQLQQTGLLLLSLHAWLLLQPCLARYDPVKHIASARLYGNVDSLAYYFVDLTVGTPAQRVSVIVDTGSGITGFPCTGCDHCGRHIDPPFDFSHSRTAEWKECGDGCAGSCKKQHCSYDQRFTEGSAMHGYWFKDFVRLGDNIQQNPPILATIGCHQDETNLFYTQKASGIMGIRPPGLKGTPTLIQQLFQDHEHINQDVFSLCIAEWGGQMVVGGYNDSYHSGKLQYIGLNTKSGFYRVSLSSMSVAGQLVDKPFLQTTIDSGTTETYMGEGPYKQLRSAIEGYCKNNKCGAWQFGTCWQPEKGDDLSKFPDIQMNFADVQSVWVAKAYLYRKGSGSNWCYSFHNDGPGAGTVLGASWMMHQEVVFDLKESRIGIVQAKCPESRDRPPHVEGGAVNSNSSAGDLRGSRPAKVKKFDISMVWAGLSVGFCIATGIMGIAAAFCRQSDGEKNRRKPKGTKGTKGMKAKKATNRNKGNVSATPAGGVVGSARDSRAEEDEEEGLMPVAEAKRSQSIEITSSVKADSSRALSPGANEREK